MYLDIEIKARNIIVIKRGGGRGETQLQKQKKIKYRQGKNLSFLIFS